MENEAAAARSLWESWFPSENLTAISAYYFAVFGLAPVVGLILGPLAFALGVVGFWRAASSPEARGGHHATFAIIAGFFESLFNWTIFAIVFILQFLNLFDFTVIWK